VSVKRYEKSNLLGKEAAKLTAPVRAKGVAAEGAIAMVLAGTWSG